MNGSGQMPHPTVGNLGMPQIGQPQYGGPVPVNGMNPQSWQPYQLPQQPAQMFIPQPGMQQYPQQQVQPQFQGPSYIPQQAPPQWQGTPLPGPAAPQQMQPQQQPRLSVNGQEILDGPGVPMELRGRTMGQAMQLYTQLADHYIRNRPQQQQQPAQQAWGQPQQQGQPQVQQQGQPQQQPQQTQFQQGITQAVQGAVQQAIEPLQEYTMRGAIRDAQQQAMQMIPDFQQLEPVIARTLAGADPRALSNPEFWVRAADLARGEMSRPQIQQPQQWGRPAPQYYGNGRAVPAQPGFPQPAYQFYAEGPTPPMGGQQGNYGDFTPLQIGMMQATGMSPDAYRA